MQLCGPGDVVDKIWHSHILHSEQYHFQCNKIFGSYLHHTPDETHSEKKDESALLEIINCLILKGHNWLKFCVPLVKIFMNRDLIKCPCKTK